MGADNHKTPNTTIGLFPVLGIFDLGDVGSSSPYGLGPEYLEHLSFTL
jgi:hypothetical protein